MHCCRICHHVLVAAMVAASKASPPPKPIQDSVEGREENFYCRKCSSSNSNVRSLPSLAAWKKPKAPILVPYILILFVKKESVNHLSSALIYRSASLMDAWQTQLREKERKENHLLTNSHHCFYFSFRKRVYCRMGRSVILLAFLGQ